LNGLKEFLSSTEVFELWNSEEDLITIYRQAIGKNFSTGEFLILLNDKDSNFLDSLIGLVSSLLSEREELMDRAGGKMSKTGKDILIYGGTYYGLAAIVTGALAYRYRKEIGAKWEAYWDNKESPEVKKKAEQAVQQHRQFLHYLYHRLLHFACQNRHRTLWCLGRRHQTTAHRVGVHLNRATWSDLLHQWLGHALLNRAPHYFLF
jgi:hypothetical protein